LAVDRQFMLSRNPSVAFCLDKPLKRQQLFEN